MEACNFKMDRKLFEIMYNKVSFFSDHNGLYTECVSWVFLIYPQTSHFQGLLDLQ